MFQMSVLQSNCMRSADYLLKSPGQTWPYSLECAETHILLCLYASFIERARQISKYFFHSCCYPSVGGSIRGIYISMIPFLTVPHPHAPQNTTSERTRCRPRARETFLPIRRLLLTLAPARPTDGLRPLLLPPITVPHTASNHPLQRFFGIEFDPRGQKPPSTPVMLTAGTLKRTASATTAPTTLYCEFCPTCGVRHLGVWRTFLQISPRPRSPAIQTLRLATPITLRLATLGEGSGMK